MKIASIRLQNFKRFVDLSIEELPPAKLVVLAGPNGNGKSSLFDGLSNWKSSNGGFKGWSGTDPYYSRDGQAFQSAKIGWHGEAPVTSEQIRRAVFIRTSYRNESEFMSSSLGRVPSALEELKVYRLIDPDVDVSSNYTRLASRLLEVNFDPSSQDKNVGELQRELFSDLNAALTNLFSGKLKFIGLGNPVENGTFYFSKGTTKQFPYMNLSGGEKAAFDLLVSLIVKKVDFNDTVFCIDEPETHMSTKLQGALLEELVRLLPENCQLWIATHSIGMMNAARKMYDRNPESVIFLDFGEADFDKPTVLNPVRPTKAFWRRVLSVALDNIADLVVPSIIVVCEGNPRAAELRKNAEHDAKCYSKIFGDMDGDTEFVSAGNSSDVQTDRLAIMSSIKKIASGVRVIPLIDRDDRAPADVDQLAKNGYQVLSKRHLESYLYDDEVLDSLCDSVGKGSEKETVRKIKQEAIAASVKRGNAKDDIKSASGEIFTKTVRALQLTQAGNDKESFTLNTLCPLIAPHTLVYQELKRDIFGQL